MPRRKLKSTRAAPRRKLQQDNAAKRAALAALERARKRGSKGLSMRDMAAIGAAYAVDMGAKAMSGTAAPGPQRAFVPPARSQGPLQGRTSTFVNKMLKHGKSPKSMKKKPVKITKDMGPQKQIIRQGTFNFKSLVGRQGHYYIPHMDALLDFGTADQVANVDAELTQALYAASLTTGGNMQYTTGSSTNYFNESFAKKQRMYLKAFRTSMKMVNTTNAPIKLSIRTIVVTRDTDVTPDSWWDQCSRAQDNADNNANTLTGFAPYNSILHYQSPDASPDRLYGFNDLFRVVDRKTVHLEAGKEHIHNLHIEYSRPVRGSKIYGLGFQDEGTDATSVVTRANNDPTAANKKYLAKYTVFTLLTVLGPKVQSSGTDVQSYAEGQLSVWYTNTTSFRNYPFHDNTKFYYNDVALAAPAGETFKIMDLNDVQAEDVVMS